MALTQSGIDPDIARKIDAIMEAARDLHLTPQQTLSAAGYARRLLAKGAGYTETRVLLRRYAEGLLNAS